MKTFSTDYLTAALQNIESFSFKRKTIICVSGGIDSMALLHAAKNFKRIIALTVDHNYRKTSAKEAKFVANFCKKIGVEHHILTNTKTIPKSNIEENLRTIRYELITDFAKKNKIKQALLAHHLDDNVETFFMRLERGSGLKGLSCMKEQNTINGITFYRPLLSLPKSSLREYIKENKIKNIEDDSNADTKFTRNKLRAFLSSITDAEIFSQRVGQSIKSLGEAENIIEEMQQKITTEITIKDKDQIQIDHKKFFDQNQQITLRIFKDILIENGNGNIPRYENLLLLYNNLRQKSFKKQTLNGCIIAVKNDKIIISKEPKPLKKPIK